MRSTLGEELVKVGVFQFGCWYAQAYVYD